MSWLCDEDCAIKKMERIEFEHLRVWGESLQERVERCNLSPAKAQNYVSAVNTVMRLATGGQWKSVRPTKDCGISPRSGIATRSRALPKSEYERLCATVSSRLAALMCLQRELGLRFKESALLNAKAALAEAIISGRVSIDDGTKGGRPRFVPVSSAAIAALERAAAIQGGRDRSMIPRALRYAEFQSACYRELTAAGGHGFHDERHAYAQERYQQLVGAPAPVAAGWSRLERFTRLAAAIAVCESEAREIDDQARLRVAEELGHSRLEVTNAYLG